MTHSVTVAFDSHREAARTERREVAVIPPEALEPDDFTCVERSPSGVGTGAAIGVLVGGAAGLLAGLGMLIIPGGGPVVVTGWLTATVVAAFAGGAAGALVGALVDLGFGAEAGDISGVRK